MAAEQNPNIKILVSCHKEVPLPKSDLYLPVQVGAANASSVIPGMQPDNAGENISDRIFFLRIICSILGLEKSRSGLLWPLSLQALFLF